MMVMKEGSPVRALSTPQNSPGHATYNRSCGIHWGGGGLEEEVKGENYALHNDLVVTVVIPDAWDLGQCV